MTSRMQGFCEECEAHRPDVINGQCHDCYWLSIEEDVRTGALNRLWDAMTSFWRGDHSTARDEMKMAWERATNTGNYAHGGHYDHMFPGWRYCAQYHSPRRKPALEPAAEATQSSVIDDGTTTPATRRIASSGLVTGSLLSPPSGPRSGLISRRDPYPFE